MKEPLRFKVIIVWVLLAVITTPIWFAEGVYTPMVAGIPLWVLVYIGTLVIFQSYQYFVVKKHWDVERFILPEEDSEKK